MGIPQTMDSLRERSAFVKDSLLKSQTITDNMVSILGSFDHRLSALETAMRPTQVLTFFPLPMSTPEKKRERFVKRAFDSALLNNMLLFCSFFFFCSLKLQLGCGGAFIKHCYSVLLLISVFFFHVYYEANVIFC